MPKKAAGSVKITTNSQTRGSSNPKPSTPKPENVVLPAQKPKDQK
jgi:hypothetical protein